ncbi:MAG: ferrous iron transport protein B [Balneolaceae bacterium]|nr:ferrous iron transport protein B [Balneolaceae bacterium]
MHRNRAEVNTQPADHSPTIALVGNPNTGKSTIFNGLTGLKQKIANYPGVTVERKTGTARVNGQQYHIVDLPGTYSLNYTKIDERITYQALIGEYEHEKVPDLVLIIVDSSNLERNLFLATQLMDLEIPAMIVLNMDDVAREKGITINKERIERKLGIPVLSVSAHRKEGIKAIKEAIHSHEYKRPGPLKWEPPQPLRRAIAHLVEKWIEPHTNLPDRSYAIEALRLISNNKLPDSFYNFEEAELGQKAIEEACSIIEQEGGNPVAAEVMARYDFINECTQDSVEQEETDEFSLTDRIDAVATHKVFGPISFVLILLVMFQAIFSWATPFMDMIDLVFIESGNWLSSALPPGILTDLLVEGVIAGLGGVVIFLPQIMFLFFFIYVLESSGYMARAAFVMDGFMTRIGLHGRSVVPLISGFACAIPGIMATRNIENWRDRIITIMVLPFMSCSARLPVYALLIAAFIPKTTVFGFINMQGLTFFGLYFFGIVMAIIAALVMNQFFPKEQQSPFMMELPDYKMPKWSVVFHNVIDRGRIFVTEAGRIIIAISIVLWFLASFPKTDFPADTPSQTETATSSFSPQQMPQAYQLKHSYAGQFGSFIEPVIEPLGFDWKIGIGLLTSFAAREVMVGTLNTIYSIEDENSDIVTLKQKLINDRDPETGEAVYSTATAVSLMIFFALAMQCMSTLAIVRRETNSWKWPLIMFGYMTTLAYLCSFLAFQIGSSL